jgi:IS5 family transposase
MRPKKQIDVGQQELFRSRLDQIIDLAHPLSRLTFLVDWEHLHKEFSPYYAPVGRAGLPIRLMIGLNLLKHIYALSDEEVCARWVENPYFQFFCGEVFFQHHFPIERSSLSHFRNRIEASRYETLLQESLAIACKLGALKLKDLKALALDTTVQEKNVAHPTEHGLLYKAINKLSTVARQAGIKVRQSYTRVAQKATIKVGRYIHAKQMRRARRDLKFMRVRLGRLIRDVERKVENVCQDMPVAFYKTLDKAKRIWKQRRGDSSYLYSWHAPEVECISKGKARAPYEFGVKVSLATNLRTSTDKGKHFIVHAQAMHGRPYDGHTLKKAAENINKIIGKLPERFLVDKGYRGHKWQDPHTKVFLSGQKRGVTAAIKRDIKRRSVIEPIIGHAKNDGLLRRNYLKGRKGDQINAIFAGIGFNFRQLIAILAA